MDRSRATGTFARRAPVAAALVAMTTAACSPDVVPDPKTLPQCAALDPICGADGDDDCCAADAIPGGKFERINDPAYPAQVSPFHLDRYEVTVGRFRAFYQGYALNKPEPGDGENPLLGAASGWDAAWDDELPADQQALLAQLQCDQVYSTWTDEPGTHEGRPVNCVSWFAAFAFCAWDGGRLPTATEWNDAAAAGNEQRLYPWGPDAPDPAHAVFGCDSSATTCPLPGVGSTPEGEAKWGHLDLAGSLAEWTLDYFGTLPTACDDACALLTDEGLGRDLRGGDFTRGEAELATTYRIGILPEERQAFIGFRCARP